MKLFEEGKNGIIIKKLTYGCVMPGRCIHFDEELAKEDRCKHLTCKKEVLKQNIVCPICGGVLNIEMHGPLGGEVLCGVCDIAYTLELDWAKGFQEKGTNAMKEYQVRE